MYKNYFKTAWRNLRKNKGFSVINITGLTIGLTCCLLIALYIQNEVSFDKFETKGDRIARVIMQYRFNGSDETNGGNYTSVRVAAVFPKTFPEVEAAVKMVERPRVVKYKDKLIDEKKFMFTDPSFFNVFSFHLLQGNPDMALAAPDDVVLTVSSAKKYFGTDNAIGKTLQIGSDSNLYRVTGVMQDCPSNSQIQFDFLASFSSLRITPDHEQTYWDANYTTYLLLKDNSSVARLQAKLPAFMKKEMAGQGATVNFTLEPFETIHLYSSYDSFVPNNSITYIYILAAVALLILIIACSTYINLSTARSLERAREVGVRKVVGAGKQQLFWQFISESILLCLSAVIISLLLSAVLLPAFNHLTDKELAAGSLFSFPFISFSLAVAIGISFLAGIYPALVLTGFQPVAVLKGSFKNTSSGQGLRKSLIVFQFAISVFLIVCTFIVQQQLYYIQHKKLGYNKEHVLVLPVTHSMQNQLSFIKQQFKNNPDVMSVSGCDRSPVEGGGGYNMRSSTMPDNEQIAVTANPVDEGFVTTTGMQLMAGTDITEQDVKDATVDDDSKKEFHFILNESAAKQLGWTPQQAIGKKMFLDASRPGYVKAVVKDFHFESLHEPIKPFVLFPDNDNRELLLKLNGEHLPQTVSFIESKWKKFIPDYPFEYHFMDDDYNALYDNELRLGKIMNLFSSIAIILACIGLFGLSTYSAQQRVKEIGVRKVLGASVSNIVFVLSKDFIQLSFVAIIIAFPVAWWTMNNWLQGYQYRIHIEWWVFIMTGLTTVLITIATVSFQAVKAAIANPVKSLRSE